jgi:Flp pilus assembly protein TadB
MFKFLPGILLIQLVTAGLVFLGVRWWQDPQFIIVIVAFGIILAILTTFWFGSIVQNMQKSTHAKMQAKHFQDREKIIRRAEREKAKVTSDSYRQREKAALKASAKTNLKMGAALAVAIGTGSLMIFSQLVTVGMMVLIAAGSGLAGYLFRVKQDRLAWKNQLQLPKVLQPAAKQIDAKKPVSAKSKRNTEDTVPE